jgi:hypothetical protein
MSGEGQPPRTKKRTTTKNECGSTTLFMAQRFDSWRTGLFKLLRIYFPFTADQRREGETKKNVFKSQGDHTQPSRRRLGRSAASSIPAPDSAATTDASPPLVGDPTTVVRMGMFSRNVSGRLAPGRVCRWYCKYW